MKKSIKQKIKKLGSFVATATVQVSGILLMLLFFYFAYQGYFNPELFQ